MPGTQAPPEAPRYDRHVIDPSDKSTPAPSRPFTIFTRSAALLIAITLGTSSCASPSPTVGTTVSPSQAVATGSRGGSGRQEPQSLLLSGDINATISSAASTGCLAFQVGEVSDLSLRVSIDGADWIILARTEPPPVGGQARVLPADSAFLMLFPVHHSSTVNSGTTSGGGFQAATGTLTINAGSRSGRIDASFVRDADASVLGAPPSPGTQYPIHETIAGTWNCS